MSVHLNGLFRHSLNPSAYVLLLSFSILLSLGCEDRIDIGPFHEKNKLPPGVAFGDTTYIELTPAWDGFESPRAIMVGLDHLIYVADYGRNEVAILDAGGTVLERLSIPRPVSLAQNTKLDLYVGGETIAPNGRDTLGAIYRVFLVRFDTTYLSRIDTIVGPFGDTTIVPVIRDTSYFYMNEFGSAHRRIVYQDPSRPSRRYVGIGILPDNGYLVARVGPDNDSFVDPDVRLLLFTPNDLLITPVGDLVTRSSGGTFITDIRLLTGLMVYPRSRNFILTQTTDGVSYGAVPMTYQKTADFDGWVPTYDPRNPAHASLDIIRPYRFRNAVAATYDVRRRELFILDAGLDSVFKFNARGQFKPESFGRTITTSDRFPRGLSSPMGIAFAGDGTLYIADTGNKVIRRFKLSIPTQYN